MRALVLLFFVFSTRILGAQIVETPVPFDSARRVLAITPAVAERFRLAAPAWPVQGEYREARLYSVDPGGGFVLVVHRASGAFERHMLTPDGRSTLRSAVDAGMATVGRPTADVAVDIVSEPAGSAFARHQTLLGAVIYGPLAASLADGENAAGALYLLTTGASFFISYSAGRSYSFTRAQSDLAGNLGLAVAGGAGLLGYAASGDAEEKGVRAIALGAALVGTIAGVELGRSLSDAEAHAATLGIEAAAAMALSATTIGGASSRVSAATVALVGAIGYPIGVRYPRRARYTVTAGDIDATSTSGLLGVLVGASALGGIDSPSGKQIAAYLSTAYVGGLLLGDRLLARPFDLTPSQANILNIGAFAGALVGAAVPVIAGSDNESYIFGAAATGAFFGMAGLASSFSSRDGAALRSTGAKSERDGGARFGLRLDGLAQVVGGMRGNHVLARFAF